MIDKSMKYTACILLPIGLAVGFFGGEIIIFIFHEEFIYAVLPLQILLIGTLINGSTSRAIGGSVSAVGRPDLDLKKVCVSASTNIILNILLIPYFGIIGAAVATSISLSITSALGIFFLIKTLQIKVDFKWYAKVFGILFLFVLIFIYSPSINKYISGCMLLSIYILIIIKFFLIEKINIIKSLFSK